jgi:hypothetical protein
LLRASRKYEERQTRHLFLPNGVVTLRNPFYLHLMGVCLILANVNVIEDSVGKIYTNSLQHFMCSLIKPLMHFTRQVCFSMMQFNRVVNACLAHLYLAPLSVAPGPRIAISVCNSFLNPGVRVVLTVRIQ